MLSRLLEVARTSPFRLDLVVSGALGLLVMAVHDVGYMLHAPYWNDEAWVAVSTKVPIHDVPSVIASTPIGWDLLLRLAPGGHPQSARMIPLAFAALTVIAAYWLIRVLPWGTVASARITGTAAGVIALLSPSALIRNDLKQYTCDAFCVLVVLGLTSYAERRGSLPSLAVLVGVGSVLFLFANPAALALGAGLASLGLVALIKRDWHGLQRVLVAGALAALVLIAIYAGFYARGNIPGLREYWATNYPPLGSGPGAVWHWFWGLAPTWFRAVGIGPAYVALPLVALGAHALARLGTPATGISIPMLFAELVVLAAMKQYPIFDLRTSHFLAIPVAVLGAVGVVALILRLGPAPFGAGAALVAVAVGAIWHARDARQHDLPIQATRQDVQTVKDGWRPGDVILTNTNGSWALAYYWGGDVRVTPTTNTQQKFRSQSVNQPLTFTTCPQADYAGIPGDSCFSTATMVAALDRIRSVTGGRSRIWVETLQARHDIQEAVIAWARDHSDAWSRPTHEKGSYLLLLTPDPIRSRQR